ncbi:hypothetical protein LA080_011631 [Diaporthe eres]|nr:hypothetical protein LA080_011631 [Diaporthe eres]
MKTILILFAAHLAAASPPTNSCNGGMVVPTCGRYKGALRDQRCFGNRLRPDGLCLPMHELRSSVFIRRRMRRVRLRE